MINHKLRLGIIILGVILISTILNLPAKGMSLLVRRILQYGYGLSVEWVEFRGGFSNGITLEDVRIKGKDNAYLLCPLISSNIRFKDFIFSKDDFLYEISIEAPKIAVKSFSSFQVNMPFKPLWVNSQILVSEGHLLLEDSNNVITLELDNISGGVTNDGKFLTIFFVAPDNLTELTGEMDLNSHRGTLEIVNGKVEFPQTSLPSLEIDGGVLLDKGSLKIERGMVSLGEKKFEIGGSIFADRSLDLVINPVADKSRFSIKGSLDEPTVATNWGVLETLFQIEGTQYDNGTLIFPKLVGEIRLPGFIPLELEGKLVLGTDHIGFEHITLAKVMNIDGVISRSRDSRLKLWLEDTKGVDLACQLPPVLKSLVSPHTVNARLSVYGGMENLQGGGTLKLFSHPIEVACRYRHNRFSFRSVKEGVFGLSGSINLGNKPNLKIKGDFRNMDFVELMSLFTKNIDSCWKGVVDGEFKISGKLNDPKIQAKIDIKGGQIGNMKFDAAYLNLEGTAERIDLKHSMVYYKEVPAELTGYINPRGKDLFNNINIIPSSDSFIWKGLNVVRGKDERTVVFGQDVNENVSVNFKSPLSSDPEGSTIDSEAEVEVKYKLLEDKSILIKVKEDKGTVGIEQKVKF